MAGCVLVGMLAAFGILCGFWAAIGWLLPGGRGGVVVCRGSSGFLERFFLWRCLFLAETGLLRCSLVVVDLGLEEPDRKWLRQLDGKIEICTPEELSSRLEWERNQLE